jgi:hypothetical protein
MRRRRSLNYTARDIKLLADVTLKQLKLGEIQPTDEMTQHVEPGRTNAPLVLPDLPTPEQHFAEVDRLAAVAATPIYPLPEPVPAPEPVPSAAPAFDPRLAAGAPAGYWAAAADGAGDQLRHAIYDRRERSDREEHDRPPAGG